MKKNLLLIVLLALPLFIFTGDKKLTENNDAPMLPTVLGSYASFRRPGISGATSDDYLAAYRARQKAREALNQSAATPVVAAPLQEAESLTWWETIFGKSTPAPASLTPAQLIATKALSQTSPKRSTLTNLAATPASESQSYLSWGWEYLFGASTSAQQTVLASDEKKAPAPATEQKKWLERLEQARKLGGNPTLTMEEYKIRLKSWGLMDQPGAANDNSDDDVAGEDASPEDDAD